MEKLLIGINSPQDLKKLSIGQLPQLAREIREKMIDVVSENGGHLASSLGSVELAIALHYLLDTPKDAILWDVGHQAYPHKILTGRRDQFNLLRQLGGLSGFPNKNESVHDAFTVGHSSTSISSALGMAVAGDILKEKRRSVAVIGDGALGGGMAFEALNHTGTSGKDLIVILNDNEMSISKPIGALSKYLNRILTAPIYNKVRKEVEELVKGIPRIGQTVYKAGRKFEEGIKNLLTPGIIFEEMGFRYFGPIDGHDIPLLIDTIKKVMCLGGPVLLHILTKKGKGYKPAEDEPSRFHGAKPFEKETGRDKDSDVKQDSFTKVFGKKIVELAGSNDRIVAITAAMPEGTGLVKFSEKFPERFFDVGIAEQHATTFAAGLSNGGLVPVVAIYSTFLQRAFDQMIHDVSLQGLHVVFCLDRAGLVGEDGPTHHGIFDIAYLRQIPHMVVMAPSSGKELEDMLEFAVGYKNGPIAIRYPRAEAEKLVAMGTDIRLGKAEVLKEGRDLAILAIGSMVEPALEAADELQKKKNINITVINARFARPLDENLLEELAEKHKHIITIEEGVAEGGFGSAVLEFVAREGIKKLRVHRLGLPGEFIEHGQRDLLLHKYHLSTEGIVDEVLEVIEHGKD